MTRAGDDRGWVLAVDVRTPERLVATAGAAGARVQPPDADGTGRLGEAPSPQGGRAPLAVVVVHPATWDDARVTHVLADVASGAPAGWPEPVPLSAPEAVAWRALEFGLVPSCGRLAVLDPGSGEATVVDRHGDLLMAVGRPARLEPGAPDEGDRPDDVGVRLVALARRTLDAAPPGPPFAGILLAGVLPGAGGEGEQLPGLVARITRRAPLVPGDPARAAVLGAAALGWAAATTPAPEPAGEPAGGAPVPVMPARDQSHPSRAPAQGTARRARAGGGAPPSRSWRRLRLWGAVVLALLVVVAVVAGLGLHRSRTAPSPFTYTCPDGQVVAYGYECATLAPSASP